MRLYWSFSEAWPDRASPLERIPGDNFRVRSSADHREAKKINGKGLSRNENRNHAAACNRALVGVGTDSARSEPKENHFGCFDASPARNGPASSSKPERAKAASTIACAFGHGEEHGPGGLAAAWTLARSALAKLAPRSIADGKILSRKPAASGYRTVLFVVSLSDVWSGRTERNALSRPAGLTLETRR